MHSSTPTVFEAGQTLAHRIEEASMNAWPAMQQILLDGWVLRFSRGFTKRANSIVPVYPAFGSESDEALLEKIRYCENLYAREQLQTVFRLTSVNATSSPRLDALLEARGYRVQERTDVLTRPLSAANPPSRVNLLPVDQWLQAYCRLTGMEEPAAALHSVILKAIAGECGFAVLDQDQAPQACGLGVVEHDLIGLFDIYTHPAYRRSGLATILVKGLLRFGQLAGASRAYLQVVAENRPALELYAKLGFQRSHEYWYRIAP
jgi:ribosomal protein S18 acetylase RimI-like enzyme